MSRYDSVLFDLDGTLLDTMDDISGALNQTLSEHGFPTHGREAVKRFISNGGYQLMECALPAYTDGATVEKLLADYRLRYTRHVNDKTRPFQGVLPMLAALDEAGLQLGIISNKYDKYVKFLTKEHFGSLIRIAVGANPNIPLKPEPDMLQAAMRELGVAPERTLYIGDAPTDYQAALNADMDCILAQWGYGDSQALSLLSPLYFAGDPAELPTLILS
ncbi:MAG TPA: HAD family hydrolase [Candidatus Limiplasma sp.]|nr:HAD family hydrolase [Candidatus Limiplasma sp.]